MTAVEELVRAAMGAGVACFMDKAEAGQVDMGAPLGDAFGDFPSDFIEIRRSLVDAVKAELAEEVDAGLAAKALAWSKSHDGGRLCVWWPAGSKPEDKSQPIMAIGWDHGGTDELGVFYRYEDAEAMETIAQIFNWALQQLAPSAQNFWGTREYEADRDD